MGWEQLRDILKENIEEQQKLRDQKTTECPECLFPLRENQKGDLLCPICGWRGKK